MRTMLVILLMLLMTGCENQSPWRLHDISGHLPNLKFSLISDSGRLLTNRSLKGRIILMYFGFTHCDAACPTTMSRLIAIQRHLGKKARSTCILYITLDPTRDTPDVLHRYVSAFNAECAIGLTGSDRAIEEMVKRYRIAYRAVGANSDEIAHSTGIYIFDSLDQARLLVTPDDSLDAIIQDLQRLLA